MKTIEELLAQPSVFLHDWAGKHDVIEAFEGISLTDDTITDVETHQILEKWHSINILFASYSYENYSGDAFVLFEKGGKLFDVYGSHCSCHGLQEQFEPNETSLEYLTKALKEGRMGNDYAGNVYAKELQKFIGAPRIL